MLENYLFYSFISFLFSFKCCLKLYPFTYTSSFLCDLISAKLVIIFKNLELCINIIIYIEAFLITLKRNHYYDQWG